MMRLRVLSLAVTTAWAAVAASAPPDAPAAPRQAVAFCNFTTTTFSYRDLTDAQKLTDMVQAQLASSDSEDAFIWLERSDIDAARRELELTTLGGIDSAASLRIGKWLKADYLVKGVLSLGDRNTRQFHIEIVGLDHADVLAARTLNLRSADGGGLAFSEADVRRTQSDIRTALNEARSTHAESRRRVLVAPLFLRNAEATSRLDFLADDVARRFQRRNREQQRVRYLQFPLAGDAIDEANLLASGLVAPTAEWQHMTDYYI